MKVNKVLVLVVVLFALFQYSWANTPGKHTVTINITDTHQDWTSFNIYRASGGGNACTGVNNPTPIGSSATTSFTDQNPPTGTVNYNASAVGSGGESACDTEVQTTVPPITTNPPSSVAAVVN